MDNTPSVQAGEKADASAATYGPTTLNLSGSASAAVQHTEIDELTRRSQSGGNWFFWIAGLSLFNSVIVLMNGRWSFLAGLGVTQFIDGIARALSPNLGSAALALALLLDLAAAGVIVLFGVMARRRHAWAFLLGMILYAVDGLLFVVVQDWLSLAFHAYALYCIYRGFSANNRLNELQPQNDRGN